VAERFHVLDEQDGGFLGGLFECEVCCGYGKKILNDSLARLLA